MDVRSSVRTRFGGEPTEESRFPSRNTVCGGVAGTRRQLMLYALRDLPLNLEIDKRGAFRVGSPDPDSSSLGQLPSLSVLRLGDFVSDVEAFLHYLSLHIPGNPTTYPCPNLKEVHLRIVSRPEAEMQRHAINSVINKRPDLALYEDTRRLSRASD